MRSILSPAIQQNAHSLPSPPAPPKYPQQTYPQGSSQASRHISQAQSRRLRVSPKVSLSDNPENRKTGELGVIHPVRGELPGGHSNSHSLHGVLLTYSWLSACDADILHEEDYFSPLMRCPFFLFPLSFPSDEVISMFTPSSRF